MLAQSEHNDDAFFCSFFSVQLFEMFFYVPLEISAKDFSSEIEAKDSSNQAHSLRTLRWEEKRNEVEKLSSALIK